MENLFPGGKNVDDRKTGYTLHINTAPKPIPILRRSAESTKQIIMLFNIDQEPEIERNQP
jgi:hypothetical protein